jgi:hypothetical protein
MRQNPGDSNRSRTDGQPSDRRRFLQVLSATGLSASVAGCAELGPEAVDRAPLRDLEPGDRTGYPGAFRFGDAYRMAVTRTGEETPTTTARFDGDDRYLRFRVGGAGSAVESYIVDGDGYVVVSGECTRYPDLDAGMAGVASVSGQPAAGTPELRMTGTTSLDGREMLVLTLPPAERPGQGSSGTADGTASPRRGTPTRARSGTDGDPHGRLTYYVDAETRYPRRLETGATVVEYRSWGDVEPVVVPDLDCTTPD